MGAYHVIKVPLIEEDQRVLCWTLWQVHCESWVASVDMASTTSTRDTTTAGRLSTQDAHELIRRALLGHSNIAHRLRVRHPLMDISERKQRTEHVSELYAPARDASP